MFGIGTPELVLIAVLLALILGPRNLPGAARKAGEIKREVERLRGSLSSALDLRGMLDPTREPPPPPPRSERPDSDGSDGKRDEPR